MKFQVLVLLSLSVLLLSMITLKPAPGGAAVHSAYAQNDSSFDQAAALAELKALIAGREQMPADSVFSNIEIMKDFPAIRLLAIMEYGFSNSLGVTCTHCHDPSDWAGESIPQKQVAREMWKMTGSINRELLSAIENLSSEMPVVNCSTCHRGQVIPATSLD